MECSSSRSLAGWRLQHARFACVQDSVLDALHSTAGVPLTGVETKFKRKREEGEEEEGEGEEEEGEVPSSPK